MRDMLIISTVVNIILGYEQRVRFRGVDKITQVN